MRLRTDDKLFTIFSAITILILLPGCATEKAAEEYVNPNIGGIGHLLVATSPDVTLPGGMVKIAPYTTPGITDKYLADKIFGFPLRESSHRRYAVTALLMASCGDLKITPAENASEFDHDFEIVTPYYYAVTLEDHQIRVEGTVSEHCALYRFTFPASEKSHLIFSLAKEAYLNIKEDASIEGYESSRRGDRIYFYAQISKPYGSFGSWQEDQIVSGSGEQQGNEIGAFASFNTTDRERILVKISHAREDITQAAAHLNQEIPDWNFDAVREKAKTAWHHSLNTLKVEGGTERERTIFYTSLYRVGGGNKLLQRMRLTDDGLLDQARRYTDKSGNDVVPPVLQKSVMFQHRDIVLITDLYLRGMRDFDTEKAYDNMKREFLESTRLPWRRGPLSELDRFYLEKGYVPALPAGTAEWVPEVDSFEKRQAVTITLRAAYESWCLAQMAKALGRNNDYTYFSKHAQDYQNVFNSRTGFMAPKSADGKMDRAL